MSILEKFKALIEDKKFDPSTAENREVLLNAAKALDGLGMLVEQAAEAYYLWRNIRPNTEIVMRELRP